jgi:GntR family transcriptional regulator/GntR family frlABCD operon transcriptional regulator
MTAPLYQKLFQSLKGQIIAGIYSEGDLLPSEHELMLANGVTRSTVRHALSELSREGYIHKKQGLGSVVSNPKRRTLGLLSVKGFSEAVGEQHQQVKTIMLDKPSLRVWEDPFFYSISAIEKTAGCIYLRRVRCAGEEPVMLEHTYIPNLNLPAFCKKPFVNGSLFETLNVRYHIEITDVEQDLRAVLAEKEVAVRLRMKPGDPLLHIFLKFHTNREHLFVYSSLLCNTERYSIGNKL